MYLSARFETALRADGRRHSSDTAVWPLCALLAVCHPSIPPPLPGGSASHQRTGPSGSSRSGAMRQKNESALSGKRRDFQPICLISLMWLISQDYRWGTALTALDSKIQPPPRFPVLSEDFKSPQLRCSMLAARCNHPGSF